MNQTLVRILGDTPLRVLVRLLFLSFVAGVVMAAIGLEPYDIVRSIQDFVEGIWSMGFSAIEKAVGYLLLGAVIVVPVWAVIRLMKIGGGRT